MQLQPNIVRSRGTSAGRTLVALGVVLAAAALLAPAAQAADPCCTITAINTENRIVTAQVKATGQVFQFQASNPALLRSLKVGQVVYANFKTRQVSLDGKTACCHITALRTVASAAGGGTAAGRNAPQSVDTAASRRIPLGRTPPVRGVVLAAVAQLGAGAGPAPAQTTIDLDPCLFASAEELKGLLQTHLGAQFPINQSNVTISNPRVVAATCPNFRVEVRTDIRYKKTRGVPQYSTSGEMRFGSPLIAKITYTGSFPPSPQNIVKAEACFTNIQVLGLNLKRIPNWLDNTWIRSVLNQKLQNSMCFRVTPLVVNHLQKGGRLR